MITHKFSATNSAASPAVTTVSPARRNTLFFAIGGLLIAGMFSVASAANRPATGTAKDPIAAAQQDATEMILDSGDDATMDALMQLRDNSPENGVYSYLIAAQRARHGEWQPAIAALRAGNEAPKLILAQSANSQGTYPSLVVLRQLVADCAAEANRSTSPETSDALLQESALLAGRIARDAQPCDLGILQTGGQLWHTAEQARIATWEREERFIDVDTARARLADRTRWWQIVNKKVDTLQNRKDPDVRIAVAKSLRAQLPR